MEHSSFVVSRRGCYRILTHLSRLSSRALHVVDFLAQFTQCLVIEHHYLHKYQFFVFIYPPVKNLHKFSINFGFFFFPLCEAPGNMRKSYENLTNFSMSKFESYDFEKFSLFFCCLWIIRLSSVLMHNLSEYLELSFDFFFSIV